MARKKISMEQEVQQEIINDESSVKRISPEKYWEWRNTITQMWLAQEKLKLSEAELKIKQKDAELLTTRAQLFMFANVNVAKQKVEEAKAKYFEFKSVLERELGMSLDGKAINDVTFEVMGLDDSTADAEKSSKIGKAATA